MAITFLQHFSNTLNCHPHFHIILADGIFISDKDLCFYEAALAQDDIVDTQEAIQGRVLRYFCRNGFFDKKEMMKMLSYEMRGFSLNARVKVKAWDSEGLERLIRYCARRATRGCDEELSSDGEDHLYSKMNQGSE